MKQFFYTKDNISKLYISPYTRIEFAGQTSFFINMLTNECIFVSLNKEIVDCFVEKINIGLLYDEVVSFFEQYSLSDELVIKLMQEGILE